MAACSFCSGISTLAEVKLLERECRTFPENEISFLGKEGDEDGKTWVHAAWAGRLLKEQRAWLQRGGWGEPQLSLRGDRKWEIFPVTRGVGCMEFPQLCEKTNLGTLENQDRENQESAQKETIWREIFIFRSFTLSSATEHKTRQNDFLGGYYYIF